MSKQPDNLQQLWQQQQVSSIDIDLVKKQWRNMRFKQIFYTAMDAFALIAAPIVVLLVPREMNTFEKVWMSSVFILLVIWFLLMVYMRRYSLGFRASTASTNDYVDSVKMQYRQNIRIAYYNKVLCYLVPLIFLSYVVIGYLGEYISPDVLWRKGKLMFLVLAVSMPPSYIWAHKREQKFKRLLDDFEARWQT